MIAHNETCGLCHTNNCLHTMVMNDLFATLSSNTTAVGSNLLDTIEWRCIAAADQTLTPAARAEHQQMVDWLVELVNLRSSLLTNEKDRLEHVWNDQVQFMKLLQKRRGFPEFPVDLSSKTGQRLVKEIAQDAAGEVFEALAHLKNAKLHRAADVPELDRSAYVEELVDAFKLLIEVAILSGVTLKEFWHAYTTKTEKNTARIQGSY